MELLDFIVVLVPFSIVGFALYAWHRTTKRKPKQEPIYYEPRPPMDFSVVAGQRGHRTRPRRVEDFAPVTPTVHLAEDQPSFFSHHETDPTPFHGDGGGFGGGGASASWDAPSDSSFSSSDCGSSSDSGGSCGGVD